MDFVNWKYGLRQWDHLGLLGDEPIEFMANAVYLHNL